MVFLGVGLFLHISGGENGLKVKELLGISVLSETKSIVFWEFRFPKIMAAILSGSAIACSGLLMQSYFRNPLAGPFVLGVSSGASLGVAVFLLGSSFLGFGISFGKFGIIAAAIAGALAVLTVVMASAKYAKSHSNLLVIGLMWAAIASSFVGILEYFATGNQVKLFLIWGMGSLLNIGLKDIWILLPVVAASLTYCFILSKKLDVMLLGKDYAQTMGINYNILSKSILILTCCLAGVITAFMGPIAFVGLAIPHFARTWLGTNLHRPLILYSILIGAIFMLWCQLLAEYVVPNNVLPINIITSIIGGPVVISILIGASKKL